MRPFEYARPTTLSRAAELLAEEPERTALLAGGTDLLALLKDDVVTAERVVSLQGVEELRGIEAAPGEDGEDGEDLRIGGGVTLSELAAHPELARRYPTVARAAGYAAGPQIRNLGTIGGNLCQRPRCWYFRLGYGLTPTHDGESMIRAGDNRYHAILGNGGDALFVSPSTLAPILIALDARLEIAGPPGGRAAREVPVADFYRVPESDGEREHDLAPGEIVTALVLPAAGAERGDRELWTTSYEVRPGASLDWSLATAAAVLEMEGDRVADARLVLGQVAPTPWRARAAEEALAGRRLSPETIAEAADAAVAGAEPLSMNRYKIELARVATRRALERLAGGGDGPDALTGPTVRTGPAGEGG